MNVPFFEWSDPVDVVTALGLACLAGWWIAIKIMDWYHGNKSI
jgi:hypothetical protein